jgi:hypothetical protein
LLSSWGIVFEAVDVERNPGALEEIKSLGARHVPCVILGERIFTGWNPKALAALVGVSYEEPERLSREELKRRLDQILAAAQRAVIQVPHEHLEMVSPGRRRTVRSVGYHVFRLSDAFCEAMEKGHFQTEWLLEEAPPEMTDGAAIAQYGQKVRERLKVYFSHPGPCAGCVATDSGNQTGHDLLLRTAWHAAQHLRQIYAFLRLMGKQPLDPMGDGEFAGLPLPEDVWS